jgi:Acetyltransferase (GNAT) domain
MTDWKCQTVELKFQLSDYILFRVCLPLIARGYEFGDSTITLENLKLPADKLPERCRGYFIRGIPITEELPAIDKWEGHLRYAPHQYNHYLINMNTSFSDYTKKFSSKTKSTLNRKLRKYREHCGGKLIWKTYSEPDQMRDFFGLAREISVLTYQERLFDGGIPGNEKFIANAILLATRDRIRAFILFEGEKPVSYLYCPVEDNVLVYAYLGYNPEHGKWSVGSILQWLALEQLFDEDKFSFFDFTEGQSEHKRLFATNHRRCANVYILEDNFYNSLLVRGHRLMDRLSGSIGHWVENLGMKAKLKRWLRDRGHSFTSNH